MMRKQTATIRYLGAAAVALLLLTAVPPSRGAAQRPAVVGRWDLTFHAPGGDFPSWLEVTEAGGQLAGRFPGRGGRPGPVKSVTFSGGTLGFTPPGSGPKR